MNAVGGLVAIEHVLVRSRGLAVFRADDEQGRRRRHVWPNPSRAPCVGETWRVEGELIRHPEYGEQVHIHTMRPQRPRGTFLRRLFAGERFPGVGEATANRLCDSVPPERLVTLLNTADRSALERVLGDTSRARSQIDTILAEWPLVDGEPDLLAWFDRHQVPVHIAAKALLCYGGDARDLIVSDPYRLLAFTGWNVVDPVAASSGIMDDDPRRLVAAVEAVLHDHLATGATVMSTDRLRAAVGELIGPGVVDQALEVARRHKAIQQRECGWQAAGPALMEEAVAERIAAELSTPVAAPSRLPLASAESAIVLNDLQADAVRMALTQRFSIVTGGAGTGKTTLLRELHRAATAAGVPVEMMALSGRAALRMREATGSMARTIAGWLVQLELGKLELDGSPLIIVDEASMVDLGSLYRILRGAPAGARFLLVGDDGQLPPVGFGLTFHALLEVEAIPRVHLTEVMRQAAETGIPTFAGAVRRGELPDLPAYDPDAQVGVSVATCAEGDVVETTVRIRRQLPQAQIVGSVKGTVDPASGGIVAMNALLHQAWLGSRQLAPADFVRGEPVMWTVNDYDLELWNGSLGRVLGPDPDGLVIRFDEGDRVIAPELLGSLELAWAITTHKAQGSSFDTVIVPVTRSRILDRTLLYTAVTRARTRVILVGDPEAIRRAVIQPPQASRRRTWLTEAAAAAIPPGLRPAA